MSSGSVEIASGTTPAGDVWKLGQEVEASDGSTLTWISVRTLNGAKYKGGYGSPALPSGRPMELFVGSGPGVPDVLIVRVAREISRATVTYRDGSETDLAFFEDPTYVEARLAPFVCPRADYLGIKIFDRSGNELAGN